MAALSAEERRLLDWMQHGLQLKQAVLAKATNYRRAGLLNRYDVIWLEYDIRMRQRVLACIYHRQSLDPADLTPHEAIWRDFMLSHAALQVSRYAGELSEEQHTAACYEIRLHRDERLRAMKERTAMAKDFIVRINEDNPRAATFMKVFGRLEVNVQSPVPHWAELPGFYEPQLVFMLDLKLISAEERTRLVDHIAEQFGMHRDEVEARLDQYGMPIRDMDCVLIIENPQRWLT